MQRSVGTSPRARAQNPADSASARLPQRTTLVALGTIVALVAVRELQQIHSPDFGFHLRIGEWILENGRAPTRDLFSSTLAGTPYVDLYWGYQAALALLFRAGSASALVISNALVAAGAVLVAITRTWRASHRALRVLPFLLLPAALFIDCDLRPHVFSWLCLGLLLLLLEEYRRNPTRWIYAAAVLMAIWINVHPLAALGWVVLVTFFAGFSWETRRFDRRLALAIGAALLVSIANPYTFRGALLPFQQLGFLRHASVFKQAIGEYSTLFTLDEYRASGRPFFLATLFPAHLFTGLAGLGLLLHVRRGDKVALLTGAGFACVLLLAVKNFEYFAFAVSPWAASGWASVAGRFAPRISHWRRPLRPALDLAVAAGAALCIILTALDAPCVVYRSPFKRGLGIDATLLPVRAAEFIRAHGLHGRLLNDISSGGYLMYALRQPVYIDGRNELYGEAFLRGYLATYAPGGLQGILQRDRPEIVVFNHEKTFAWAEALAGVPEWRLVYLDDVNMVFVRADVAPELPPWQISSAPGQPAGWRESRIDSLIDRRWPQGRDLVLSMFGRRQYYPFAEIREGALRDQYGDHSGAVLTALRGLERATVFVPTLYLNLGTFFYEQGQPARARRCYERFVEAEPDPRIVQRIGAIRAEEARPRRAP